MWIVAVVARRSHVTSTRLHMLHIIIQRPYPAHAHVLYHPATVHHMYTPTVAILPAQPTYDSTRTSYYIELIDRLIDYLNWLID